MSTSTDPLSADLHLSARIGDLLVTVEERGRGIPASSDPHFDAFPRWVREPAGVEKMVARFAISTVDSSGLARELAQHVPFFYGNAASGDETCDARVVIESVWSDIQSIYEFWPEAGSTDLGTCLAAWADWTDNAGFVGDICGPEGSAHEIVASIEGFRTIATWTTLLEDVIGEGRLAELIGIPADVEDLILVSGLLLTSNPNDPSGQWSLFDIIAASGLDEERVPDLAALTGGGGRYVGGTSGHLYHLMPTDGHGAGCECQTCRPQDWS